MLSKEAIKWIKDHREEISNIRATTNLENWISKIPASIFVEVINALETANVDFDEPDRDDYMWGIKTWDGKKTLTARKYNGTSYNVSLISSAGMQGGFQVGFKSFKDALKMCEELSQVTTYNVRPSKMVPKTVTQYKWTEVDTICGKAYFSDAALKQYDPSPQNQNRKKYDKELNVLLDGFNLRSSRIVKDIISEITENNYVFVFSHVDVDSDKHIVSFSDLYATEKQLREILLELTNRFKQEFKREKPSRENYITLSSALPQSLKNKIEELKNKYGI